MVQAPPALSMNTIAPSDGDTLKPNTAVTISGFTVVRNAIIMGYPVVQSSLMAQLRQAFVQ